MQRTYRVLFAVLTSGKVHSLPCFPFDLNLPRRTHEQCEEVIGKSSLRNQKRIALNLIRTFAGLNNFTYKCPQRNITIDDI